MTDTAMARLLASKTNADKLATDRKNYADYVADRIHNGWEVGDVAEYRADVERIMRGGTDDEKSAASEFWALKAAERETGAPGINDRIRLHIASSERPC